MSEVPSGLDIRTIIEGKDNKVSEEVVGSNRFDFVFDHLVEIVWSIYSLAFELTCEIRCIHPSPFCPNVFIFALRDTAFAFIHEVLRNSEIEITWRKLSLRFPTVGTASVAICI